MGIAYKDLKVGSFYKGYHQPAPTGLKCFYYVTQNSYSPGQVIPALVEVVFILRHQTTTTWSPLLVYGGLPDEESLMKQEVRLSALHSENVSPPVQYAPHPLVRPVVVSTLPTSGVNATYVSPSSVKQVYRAPVSEKEAAAAAAAKAERNKGKVTIPENAHSPRCVKCNGANQSIALLQFNAYYCDRCEPT